MSEERGTIEDVIEPFLIQQGFLMRTARGRVATRNAYAALRAQGPGDRARPELAAVPGPALDARDVRLLLRASRAGVLGGHGCGRRRLLRQLPSSFFERCRTEWLRSLGVDQPRLKAKRALQFVVANMTVDFLRPAVLDDEVLVTAELCEVDRCENPIQTSDMATRRTVDRRHRPRRLPGLGHASAARHPQGSIQGVA